MQVDANHTVNGDRLKLIPSGLNWRPDALLHGDDDGKGWMLFLRYEVKVSVSGTWLNGKLIRCESYHPTTQRAFPKGSAKGPTSIWLGWNGERFARSADFYAVLKKHPTMMTEVAHRMHRAWMLMTAGCADLNNGGLGHV